MKRRSPTTTAGATENPKAKQKLIYKIGLNGYFYERFRIFDVVDDEKHNQSDHSDNSGIDYKNNDEDCDDGDDGNVENLNYVVKYGCDGTLFTSPSVRRRRRPRPRCAPTQEHQHVPVGVEGAG